MDRVIEGWWEFPRWSDEFEQGTDRYIENAFATKSQQHEEGATNKDPYYEVIKKAEHNGRLRLFGKGVTQSTLKKKGTKCDYIFPQEFLQSMQMQVVKSLQEANPELDIVIPEFVGGSSSKNPTSGAPQVKESSSRPNSIATKSPNQVQLESNGLEAE